MTTEMQPCIRGLIRSLVRAVGVALLALVFAGLPALAQLDTGSISGTVADLPGARSKK